MPACTIAAFTAYGAQDGTGQDVTKMAGGNAGKLIGPSVDDHA
jgi:hypothetical protein